MSTTNFLVKAHKFPGQHIREYAGATRHREEDTQFLEAKQYVPLNNQSPRDGDITILGGHAMSFPKEMYEPLWDDLLESCSQLGIRIRSIWIADACNSGASGVLNERSQGDEPSFFDHARDLLHMINTFRDDFPQPVVGIGHSMGATALMQLSLSHPRILASLIVYDPTLGTDLDQAGSVLLYVSSIRQDLWPSRQVAEKAFRSAKAMRAFDPRVLELWLQYGLRETPTLLYPEPGNVTLTMTKANESFSYVRSFFEPLPGDGQTRATPRARAKYPDLHGNSLDTHPFYYSMQVSVWTDLPRIRPGVKFVFPERSVTTRDAIREIVERTGVGGGGNGGVREHRVEEARVDGASHVMCFEKPRECASIAADWLSRDVKAWHERRKLECENRDDKSVNQMTLSAEWIRQARLYFEKVNARHKSELGRSMLEHRARLL